MVWESLLFLIASWSNNDQALSCYALESSRCNLRSIFLSHEKDPLFFLMNLFFADKRNFKKKKDVGHA